MFYINLTMVAECSSIEGQREWKRSETMDFNTKTGVKTAVKLVKQRTETIYWREFQIGNQHEERSKDEDQEYLKCE